MKPIPMEIPVLTVSTDEGQLLSEWINNVTSQETDEVRPVPFIADNASADETAGVLWGAIKDGFVAPDNVRWLHTNRGFSAAQNQLIRALGALGQYRWFATLNIDAIPDPNWLARLVEEIQRLPLRSKCGMVGGLITQTDSPDRVSSAGHALRGDGSFLDVDYDRPVASDCRHSEVGYEPFSPCFAASLWSTDLIKECGLPDSHQFLYYDDVELAYKARLTGWSARFVKGAVAGHPLPNRKLTVDTKRDLQLRGKLLIVHRYFPDEVRDELLAALDADGHRIAAALSTREKAAYVGNEVRRAVYQEWAGKWL